MKKESSEKWQGWEPTDKQDCKDKEYKVVQVLTNFLSKTLNGSSLENTLNEEARNGYKFVKSIVEKTRFLGIFGREAHFLIFERDKK